MRTGSRYIPMGQKTHTHMQPALHLQYLLETLNILKERLITSVYLLLGCCTTHGSSVGVPEQHQEGPNFSDSARLTITSLRTQASQTEDLVNKYNNSVWKRSGLCVVFLWTKAHMGILGNDRAEKVTNKAVNRSIFERGIKVSVRRQQYGGKKANEKW